MGLLHTGLNVYVRVYVYVCVPVYVYIHTHICMYAEVNQIDAISTNLTTPISRYFILQSL